MTSHVGDRLSAYLDDELRPLDREAVESHLRACEACAARLEEMAAVDTLARELPVEAPPGYFDSLPGRVRARMSFPARRRPVVPVWSWAVAAALLLAVVVPRMVFETRAPSLSDARFQEAPAAAPARPAVPPPAEPAKDAAAPTVAATPAPPAQAVGGVSGRLARSNEAGRDAERSVGGAEAPKLRQAPMAETKKAEEGAADSDLQALAKRDQGVSAPRPAAAAPGVAPPPPPQSAPEESVTSQFRADELKEQVEVDSATATAPAAGGLAAASPKGAREERRAKRADKSLAASTSSYASLLSRTTATAAEARALREEWRAFAESHPTGTEGDEARVRVVELGISAWRLSNDPADKALVRQDAEAYLRRDDAAQGQRVRTLLREIGS